MSRFKLFAFIALITLAFAVTLVADVAAGEKMKCRSIKHMTKTEVFNIGVEEGHAIFVFEAKGINTNLLGKPLFDGLLEYEVGVLDMNLKTGQGSGHGYAIFSDLAGDKIFMAWEGKLPSGTWTLVKGTGKFQGIRGNGTWSPGPATTDPNEMASNFEGEVELPR
jgi:hypothetical protein